MKYACHFTLQRDVIKYFEENHRHIDIHSISTNTIAEFFEQSYLDNLPNFEARCECFRDHIMAQGLTYIQE